MKKPRYIVHVDMDAFFAAIEQRDNPSLNGKSVIVGSDPKLGRGRGVVSTCSYEARKLGIHSAMPISIAYKKCPDAVFLPVDFEKYSRVSQEILNILEEFSPLVEQVSIDEAFLDITDSYKIFGDPHKACVLIKERIKSKTGLTASVGLAPTKMAAKIASGLKKPDGLVEVDDFGLVDFLKSLDVGLVWGVGGKTKEALGCMGVQRIGDLALKSKEELVSVFGKSGIWFWETARGIDDSQVVSEREIKSVSNETTFEEDTYNRTLIESELVRLSELVSSRLREEDFKARTITLKIRTEGFKTYTRAKTLDAPTNFSEDIIKAIRELYYAFGSKNKKIRLVGVRASNLSSAAEHELFSDKADAKKEAVHKALDKIKHKFGGDSIHRASSR